MNILAEMPFRNPIKTENFSTEMGGGGTCNRSVAYHGGWAGGPRLNRDKSGCPISRFWDDPKIEVCAPFIAASSR